MSDHLPASADVAVIGGGVIGLSLAWRAVQRGLKVAVLERDRAGGATSRIAAGMLAPVAEADPSEQPLLALGIAASAAYPDFIAELRECSPRNPGYLRCGTLVAARDADEAEALTRALVLRTDLGLPVRRLRRGQARALEPALSPGLRLALELPSDHAVDPRALTATLADAVVRAGGVLCEGAEVARVECGNDRVKAVVLGGGRRVACEQVVMAAGAWSAQISGLPPGAEVPLRPVKGQILRMHDPAGPGLLSRVLRLEDAYVVPRGDGRYVLGATVEERGFDVSVTAGAVLKLLQEATELLPGLSELVIDDLAAGLRPGTPDNAPLIGPGAVNGLHWATGHYRAGVLLAPVTATLVAGMLAGEQPDVDLSPFAPGRFSGIALGAAR